MTATQGNLAVLFVQLSDLKAAEVILSLGEKKIRIWRRKLLHSCFTILTVIRLCGKFVGHDQGCLALFVQLSGLRASEASLRLPLKSFKDFHLQMAEVKASI